MVEHQKMQESVGKHLDNLGATETIMDHAFSREVGGPLGKLSERYGVGADTFRGALGRIKPDDPEYQRVLDSVISIRDKWDVTDSVSEKFGSRSIRDAKMDAALAIKNPIERSQKVAKIIGGSFTWWESAKRLYHWQNDKKAPSKAALAEKYINAREELSTAKEQASVHLSYTLLEDPVVKESLRRRALGIEDEPKAKEGPQAAAPEQQRQQGQGFPQMYDYSPIMQLISALRGAPAQPERNDNLNLILQLLLAILQFRGERALHTIPTRVGVSFGNQESWGTEVIHQDNEPQKKAA